MALATLADVQARLGRDLTDAETTRADGLLDEASALVVGYLGTNPEQVYYDEMPDAIVIVTSRMVARVLQQASTTSAPIGASQQNNVAGPFSQQFTFQAGANTGGPWIDSKDKIMLRPFRRGGGMTVVTMRSDRRVSVEES